jgi:hypothetical protein
MIAPVQALPAVLPDPPADPDSDSDSRFTWGLIIEVFDVLERRGYQRGGGQHTGQAIGLLFRLADVYEHGYEDTP